MPLLKDDFKHILVDSALITAEEFAQAGEQAQRSGRGIADVLVGKRVISEQFLTEALAGFFETPIVNFEQTEIDATALHLVPESLAKNRSVVLFAYDPQARRGKLAMLDPEDFTTINHLRARLNAWLDVYLTSPSSLTYGLKQYKKKVSEEFSAIIEKNVRESIDISGMMDVAKMIEQVPIITILDTILEHAVTMGASDIHFEPFEEKFVIRYRIDGIMQEILLLPAEIAPVLVARVKVMTNLQIDVHAAPQDGRFRFTLDDQFIDVRVSVIPTFHGEKVEMRLLKGSLRPLNLLELGLAKKDLERLEEEIKRPHGMVLVTGPTGMGKTTTLYSIISILNTPQVNITTIEDPIEYDIRGVNQTQVNVKSGLTFANGLRSLVRQNPDIIMVGEIRDGETADIAVNAALTGHLLLSTLHTNDAAGAVTRLADFDVPPFLIASTVNIIMAQRLVRRICLGCIASAKLGKEIEKIVRRGLRTLHSKEGMPSVSFSGRGCKACSHTGLRGQIGIFEVLYVTDAIRDLITKNTPSNIIRDAARKEGMRLMFEDGLEKVEAGLTTIDEVLRVTRE